MGEAETRRRGRGRPRIIDEEKQRQAIEFYRKRFSERKVAGMLGISNSAVHSILIRHDEPRRRRSDAVSAGRMKYPKTDFSGDLEEQARICGFMEDCSAERNGKQIRVETATTHFPQMKVFNYYIGRYGHVSDVPSYNKKFSLYQWRLRADLSPSFEFVLEYKKNQLTLLNEIAKTGHVYGCIAGQADAEGWVGIYVDHGYPRAALEITNNNRRLLEWTQKILGGRIRHIENYYRLALSGEQAVEAMRTLPIIHAEKVAAKELILRHFDNGGIGLPALREYRALRRRIDEEVQLCTTQARLEWIRRHGKPHPNDPDQAIPPELTFSPSFPLFQ